MHRDTSNRHCYRTIGAWPEELKKSYYCVTIIEEDGNALCH